MTGRTAKPGLLDRVLAAESPAFALIHRPERAGRANLDVLAGEVTLPGSLAEVPLAADPGCGLPAHDFLVVAPYRQIAERGFAVPDDGAPLIAISITAHETVPIRDVLTRIPGTPSELADAGFDVDDAAYADFVRRIIAEEIGNGEGSNFVIKRSFAATICDYSVTAALSFFRRLLEREQGAYWTFIIHAGSRTFVGATPERHVTLNAGTVVMNPISGTYRYPPTGPTLDGIIRFLADGKETDELYMVLDEELKMMARICDSGGTVTGPYLKEMTRLAHTEYFIEGKTGRDVREILRETMFAPTVMGSPLESAARVIRRYEPEGRSYYSGFAALIGRDANGAPALDSAILIRTAEIDANGRLRIAAGATLVRHSDPAAEAAETHAKATGLISALQGDQTIRFGNHPAIRAALRRRNAGIADFWLHLRDGPWPGVPGLVGMTALVIDAEDAFTAMLGHQLGTLGLAVTIRRFDEPCPLDDYDLVVLGPGPGNPDAASDPKIARLRSVLDRVLAAHRPFVAVCLSHQVTCRRFGFALERLEIPNQGVQRDIDLFGTSRRVGFYNTFAAISSEDKREIAGIGLVEVSRDPETSQVYALRGPRFATMQFHAESVLTVDGPGIITETVREVLDR